MGKNFMFRILYFLRDLQSRAVFRVLHEFCKGEVLDIGGWDFYLTAKKKSIPFTHWTTLEYDQNRLLNIDDPAIRFVVGNGCAMDFEDESFDTILNLQVLEHVMDPITMVEESARVLKSGGYGVYLIPQTGVVHLEPHHYYNFTVFWIREVMARAGLTIEEEIPIGGTWASMASHHFHFIFYTFYRKLKSPTGARRSVVFYLLYPLMVVYAVINIPLCMLLALGDLSEECNNHLVVVRKP